MSKKAAAAFLNLIETEEKAAKQELKEAREYYSGGYDRFGTRGAYKTRLCSAAAQKVDRAAAMRAWLPLIEAGAVSVIEAMREVERPHSVETKLAQEKLSAMQTAAGRRREINAILAEIEEIKAQEYGGFGYPEHVSRRLDYLNEKLSGLK